MGYLITHFFEGGSQAQYEAMVEVVHPEGALPEGQTYHAAGPTEGGWLVVAVWESKDHCDTFVAETLMPAMGKVENGFAGPPQERAAEIVNEVTAGG